jgi:hypothetical protein
MNTAPVRRFVAALLAILVLVAAGSAASAEFRASDYPGSGAVDSTQHTGYRASDYPGSGAAVTPLNQGYQLFDAAFTNGDLVATTNLVAEDAVIDTDTGSYVGPQGLLDYVQALVGSDRDVVIERVEVEAVGDLVILRWEADLGGSTYHGRTLATVENGEFTRISMLNESVTSSNPEIVTSEVATGIYPAAPGLAPGISSAASEVDTAIYPAAPGVDY